MYIIVKSTTPCWHELNMSKVWGMLTSFSYYCALYAFNPHETGATPATTLEMENQVTERLSKRPKVKKTVNDTVDIWVQTSWLQESGYYLVDYSASLNEPPYAW